MRRPCRVFAESAPLQLRTLHLVPYVCSGVEAQAQGVEERSALVCCALAVPFRSPDRNEALH
jgi:hypothetical protein